MSGQEDVGTMADMVKGSHGIVIIPSFYKGAIGLGDPIPSAREDRK